MKILITIVGILLIIGLMSLVISWDVKQFEKRIEKARRKKELSDEDEWYERYIITDEE